MKRTLQGRRRRSSNSGFSLIELLLAMLVLTIGLLGGMIVILTAIASNARNRFDTAGVALAQSTMDRIIVLSASAGIQATSITDCTGTARPMTTAPGGAPLVDLSNISNGLQVIDFTQAPVPGYQMYYTLCATGASDGLATGNPQIYDVRWNVSNPINGANGGSSELIQVAAKNLGEVGNGGQQSRLFNLPVTLRALRGN
jgi:prepilin-type N-terminal cleavage/methylation domain-containing protein